MKIPRFEQEKRAKTFWMAEKVLLMATDLAIVIILLRTLSHIYHYFWENFPALVELENLAWLTLLFYLLSDFIVRALGWKTLRLPLLLQLISKILFQLISKIFGYPLALIKNLCVRRSIYFKALKPLSQENWCHEKFVLKFAEAIWSYCILDAIKCPLSLMFLEDIVKHFAAIAKHSFQCEQVSFYLLKSWKISLELEILEICEEAVENTLLFESIDNAREFAQLLYYYVLWDGCNAVKIIDYDGAAIETAIELLDARYCQQGEICFLNCVENQNNFSF